MLRNYNNEYLIILLNVYISNYFLKSHQSPFSAVRNFGTRIAATSLYRFFFIEFWVKDYAYVYTLDFRKLRRKI